MKRFVRSLHKVPINCISFTRFIPAQFPEMFNSGDLTASWDGSIAVFLLFLGIVSF